MLNEALSAAKQQEYEVRLTFEGPLDRFYLVKSEVSMIYIGIRSCTPVYPVSDLMRDLNIDIASEYLHGCNPHTA